jgi:isoquinoline 1-oxidoreductase beta subunit
MRRRAWLLSAVGVAGALVVGWGFLPPRSRKGAPELFPAGAGEVALNGWIKIAADGGVVLAMPRSEMGQGVHTALPMLVAEELDVPLARIRIEQAGADSIYGNVSMFVASLPFHPLESEAEPPPAKVRIGEWMVRKLARELGINATGGSSSVADAWDVMRTAAATARASLLAAAARQWNLPMAELTVREGVIHHATGRTASYAEMAALAAGTSPGEIVLKPRKDWRVIGQSLPRLDVPAKVDGRAVFGLDVRLPDMLFAAVRQCPMLGGSVESIQATTALAMPGVQQLVELPSYAGSTAGLAIVGRSSWHAMQAVGAVDVKWQQRPAGALDSKRIESELEAAVKRDAGFTFYSKGSVDEAQAQASDKIVAWYRAPYLAHATMEPMNCTAQVSDGRVEVWAPTQVPQMARAIAARVAGVSKDKVTVHVTLLGGGFGRRLEVDFVAQAVKVAMACGGRPVQLLWSREEDMTHDYFRPMQVALLQASLDKTGALSSLSIKSAGDAITPRWMERTLPALSGPFDMPDKTAAEGLFDLPYGIANQHMAHVATRMGVPVGFWRSVGHSHNAFFSESFIDEIASQSRQDPLEFRRKLLKDAPRYLAVLNLAAEKADWSRPLPAGRARGVALHESFGSIVAQVVEASLVDGKPRVHRVVCAADCGTVVNPGIVAQQVEGSVVYALSAALYSRVDIQDGVVQQTNFPGSPAVLMQEAPRVETWLVSSTRTPGGVGEPAVPPLAPALGNALFALTGRRLRSLPFSL